MAEMRIAKLEWNGGDSEMWLRVDVGRERLLGLLKEHRQLVENYNTDTFIDYLRSKLITVEVIPPPDYTIRF